MIPTTQDWKDYSVDYSNYQPYILVTKNSDVVWSFTVDNIQEGTLRFTDDVSSLGGFNIGATPSNKFECDIINFDQTFPSPDVFEGCMARLYFFLSDPPTLGGTNAVVGQAIVGQAVVNTESSWSADYICRGHYYLDPITSIGSTVHISGSDAMSLEEFNSSNIDGYQFGDKTCMQVIRELGFNIQNTFPNYDYVLPNVTANEEHNMSGISRRTILGHIASMCGCYARYSHEGQLELRVLGDDPTVTVLTKIMEEPDVDYYPIEVTGAYVTGSHDVEAIVGGSGYYFFVENNPLITSNDEATAIATHIATLYDGFALTPFSMNIIADPALEAGDIVEFESNGNTVQSIVTSVSYHDGGTTQISAEADSDTHATAEAVTSSIGYVKRSINDLYSGETLKKIINISGDAIKLNADTVDLTGAVFVDGTINCNNRFVVDPEGNVTANSFKSESEAETNITEQIRVTYTNPYNDELSIVALRGTGFITYVYNDDIVQQKNEVVIAPGNIYMAMLGSAMPSFQITQRQNDVHADGYILGTFSIQGDNNIITFDDGLISGATSVQIEGDVWSGLNTSSGSMSCGARNSENNALVYAQASGNKVAGLYHLGDTGYNTAKWLIYINSSGTVTSTATSDKRLKNEVGELTAEEANAVLSGVRPINYVYKADDDQNNVQNGIYAQDLRDALLNGGFGYRTYLSIENALKTDPQSEEPDFFNDLDHNEDEVRYGIDYSKLVPVLIKGWQMHEEQINELQRQIEKLEGIINGSD